MNKIGYSPVAAWTASISSISDVCVPGRADDNPRPIVIRWRLYGVVDDGRGFGLGNRVLAV
jgi:hypothetical protein